MKHDDHKDNKDNTRKEVMRGMALFTQMGLSMTVCVLLGVLAGKYLDRWLHSSPWMLIIFSLLGAASAIKLMYDLAMKK